ncbi:hypothetical protein C8R45DRAFT_1113533 [Mycena sanguinolenta]|nr:hypothetical protein C8R45DRAFT_1113533 [Mycena sanguinolenta]
MESLRHPDLYFDDGSLTLQAGDGSGVLYNVYRGQLQLGSELFGAILTLPHPNIPAMTVTDNARQWFQKARSLGLDGTSDELALVLPPQLAATEIEKYLHFVYLQEWTDDQPSIETACAILKVSHFLAAPRGIAYAKRCLDMVGSLPAVQHLVLGFNYGFDSWIKMAFDELMLVPVNDISKEDEAMIGWPAFRALAKAQLQVMDTRLNLAVRGEWAKMWTSMDGVLGALIKEELPGSQILEKLPTLYRGSMNSECHRRTCDGLKGSVDKLSILREEEELIDKAVEELMSSAGIPLSK